MYTIVVPAYNEEAGLREAVRTIMGCAKDAGVTGYEIIVVNDGSQDGTRTEADALAAEYPCVKVIHHERNSGLGACFLDGLRLATQPRITYLPGDGVVTKRTIRHMLRNGYRADFVGAYLMNIENRGRLRRVLSALFNMIYTNAFNLPIKYIHATPVYSVEKLRKLDIRASRYSFQAEICVKMLRKGATFLEIEGYNNLSVTSSALRLRNMLEVARTFLRLLIEIHLLRRGEYLQVPKRVLPPESL